MTGFNQARDNLLPKIGATTYTISRQAILDMPQGENTPIDKVILQFPGVSYDSAVSNPNFHVRNEYANVQIRINGVIIPEGVSGLGMYLDTNFIGSMSLLTGALPAQYGLRTAGVLDITSRSFATPGGEVSLYGGSRQTITPSFDYGGSVGNTSISSPGAAIGTISASKMRRRASTPSTIKRSRASSSATVSTLLDEFDAFQFDLRRVPQRVSDPQQSQSDAARRFRPDRTYNSSTLNEKRIRHLRLQYRVAAKEGHRRRRAIRLLLALRQGPFRPRYIRRPGLQRRGSDVTRESTLDRHPIRHILHRQRPPHAARRLRGERRANQCDQHVRPSCR